MPTFILDSSASEAVLIQERWPSSWAC